MIFVNGIAFGGVLSLSKEISKIRHSTVTLVLTTITEVLTDAHIIFKHAPPLAIPAILDLKHHPPLDDSGLSYIFRHAPHLAIPAVIDLKHAPRLGDAGSSYIFNHAPHLAIPAIIVLKQPPPFDDSGISYIYI